MSSPPTDAGSLPGRESRFEGMVRQYGRLISTVVARVGGQATSLFREDIEQQVLIELWRQVDREQKIDHPSSYLYRAAVRETVRVLKRELSREAASTRAEGDGRGREPVPVPGGEGAGGPGGGVRRGAGAGPAARGARAPGGVRRSGGHADARLAVPEGAKPHRAGDGRAAGGAPGQGHPWLKQTDARWRACMPCGRPSRTADHLGEDDWLALAGGDRPAAERERRDRPHRALRAVRARLSRPVRAGGGRTPVRQARAPGRRPGAAGRAGHDALGLVGRPRGRGDARLGDRASHGRPWRPSPEPNGSELRGPGDARPALLDPVGGVGPLAGDGCAGSRSRRPAGTACESWAARATSSGPARWSGDDHRVAGSIGPRAGRTYWQVTAYPQGGTDADGVASVLASFDYQPVAPCQPLRSTSFVRTEDHLLRTRSVLAKPCSPRAVAV